MYPCGMMNPHKPTWQLIFRGIFLKLSKITAIWFYHYLIMGVKNMFGGGFLRVVRNVYTVGTDVYVAPAWFPCRMGLKTRPNI